MKHFLIGEDDVSYHVHDGKINFLVAKKGINEKIHSKIKALPKYAEGGMVEEEPAQDVSLLGGGFFNPANPKAAEQRSALAEMLKGGFLQPEEAAGYGRGRVPVEKPAMEGPAPASVASPVASEQPETLNTAQAVPSGASTAPQVMPAAPQQPNFLGQFQQGQAMQAQGIQKAADIQSKLAEDQAKVLEAAQPPEFEQKLKERINTLDQERVKVQQEIDAFKAAGAEDKIDPNRVWNNMSTGNKVLATISLILGGAGSGGNAANNAGLNILNNSIDKDIKAQQANIDKKTNLYKMNLDRMKDISSAEELTRLQLSAITQGKIAALAAKSNSELAKANATQMIGQLKKQDLEIGMKLYDRQREMAIKNAFLGAKPGQVPTEQAINYLVPEGDRKAAREELQDVNGYKNAVKAVSNLFGEIKDIGISGKIPFTESKSRLEKVRANTESVIRNSMKGQGALSDRDMENVIRLMPDATDTDAQRKQKM
jgi:hypothetical protein